jgi:hypothetical protein
MWALIQGLEDGSYGRQGENATEPAVRVPAVLHGLQVTTA